MTKLLHRSSIHMVFFAKIVLAIQCHCHVILHALWKLPLPRQASPSNPHIQFSKCVQNGITTALRSLNKSQQLTYSVFRWILFKGFWYSGSYWILKTQSIIQLTFKICWQKCDTYLKKPVFKMSGLQTVNS